MPAFASSPITLLALVLVSGASLTVQPAVPTCPSRLELVAEPTAPLPEVCISPGLPTTFRFHAPLPPGTSVAVKGRERFADVPTGDSSFAVLPLEDLQPGERFEVTVRFTDGAAPTSVTFPLAVHPAWAPRQVEVFRHRRTVEDFLKETREEREKALRLGQELEQLQVEKGPSGLTGLLASRVLGLDEVGVRTKNLLNVITRAPTNTLRINEIYSYRANSPRAEGGQDARRVAVAMVARNMGTPPWQAHEAVLAGKGQEAKKVRAWSQTPLLSGQEGLIVIETELTEQEARRTYTLKLWDDSGHGLVTLGNITFP